MILWHAKDLLNISLALELSAIFSIFIKIQQIKWAGHVVRMDENHTTKKVFNAQPISTRRKGRPNIRWIDGLEKYLLVLRTKNWRTLARRRLPWKSFLEKAKAHPELSRH
ncbi:uncharacterized protein TNCV_10841 [Trichonephila clavipes]|nr:uncharacterized protein TNCV_10841 [Trichonephila clavipes]